jgi:glycosyltransferase involved in cell wall biosynthesis
MAMGLPVVSTSLGVEGLPVRANEHLLVGDSAEDFAAASLRVLDDHALRARLSASARSLIERDHSHEVAARAFERCCLNVVSAARARGAIR